tara:strand:+ start:220 stop:672 length:453 start_codon:yes stop_codon:yes gene_type:complete
MNNIKQLQRKMDEINKNDFTSQEVLKQIHNYLNDRLAVKVDESSAEVVSLLIWDRGRTRINCYLNQIKEIEIIRGLNLSFIHHIHYPNGTPSENAYQHGFFVPVKQQNQHGELISYFKKTNGQDFPENSYIALGRNIPMKDLEELVTISY